MDKGVLKEIDGSAAGLRTLVVNAGSTSVKISLVDRDDTVILTKRFGTAEGHVSDDLRDFLKEAGPVDIVGHRIVHGGSQFNVATYITRDVRRALEELNELAPLHNPPALAGIDAVQQLLPDVAQVACFDTSFHVTLSSEAKTYAVPAEWGTKWGIRRYGFHGISCAWAAPRAAQILGRPTEGLRMVICHLGGGASATAVVSGRSIDTTMGFTPIEGLVMATRPGDLDVGALLWALNHGLSLAEASKALEFDSGLFGLSGKRSSDLRELFQARESGDELAKLAISVYLHRLRAKIAAMVAASSGIDVLVFTGGVGENSELIRKETCAEMKWLGIDIDDHSNSLVGEEDADISKVAAQVRTLVIHAREEIQIARECRRVLGEVIYK